MAKRVHILIVEPSAIIRCGVVTLLGRAMSQGVTIAESAELPTPMMCDDIAPTPDLLIVNPSYLGLFSLSQLRSDLGGEQMRIVALQSAFVDQRTLSGYDEVISINDSVDVIRGKIENVVSKGGDEQEKRELSGREREIIVCVVKGMTNKQIADELFLSAHTVIAHRRNIASKLQIHSPAGLTIYAIVNKLVNLEDIKGSM